MENTKCRRFLIDWLPLILYGGLLFYLSSLSHPHLPRFAFADKLAHLALYAVFGFLLIHALHPAQRGWTRRRAILVAGLGTVLYGVSDEIHQFFVPLRTPEVLDVVTDGLGGLLGGVVYLRLRRLVKG